VDDLRSAYEADDEIKPLLFDIEDALEHVANEGMTRSAPGVAEKGRKGN
jgi:hypothetical protein